MIAPLASALVVAILLSHDVLADFALSGRSTLTALNMPSQGREMLYVKKDRMRRDMTERGRSYSYLYDLKKREVAVVDHFLRQVQVRELAPAKSGKAGRLSLKLAPTGRKHQLQDWACAEQKLTARLPGTIGQEQVTLALEGEVWLVGKASERKELDPFIKGVGASDFFTGVAPGAAADLQAQGLNEAMRKVLENGMLCAADIRLDYEGGGQMADLGRRMASKASVVYDSVSRAAIKDDMFDYPAGYRVVTAPQPALPAARPDVRR